MSEINNNDDIAIKVNNVSTLYKLYDKPSDRLKESLGLTKKKLYKEHYALHNVDMEIKKGECVGIIGTNGAGKSTILKIITGVLNPTEGDVQVNGRISALLELGAGFNMEYTGIENVYINGTMIGFTREEIDAKLDDILSFADIGDFVYQPVKTYSSGMFVRLAFAVAINIDPEILIVDEALSVGDVFFQAKCFHKFEEFKAKGKTILFVSHALPTISKYCDRAILLNKGKKIAEDEPKPIIDLYNKLLVNNYSEEEIKKELELSKHDGDIQVENEIIQKQKQMDMHAEHTDDVENWKDKMYVNPKAVEYGNKDAEIVDFCIINSKGEITNTIDKDEKYGVRMKVHFNKKIQDPILAFTIKDLKGTELTGTNTMIEDVRLPENVPGMDITVQFDQVMLLRAEQYLLALGCTGFRDGEFTVYHRLYDVCNLQVNTPKDIVGVFDSHSEGYVL